MPRCLGAPPPLRIETDDLTSTASRRSTPRFGTIRRVADAESLVEIGREWRALEEQAACSFFLSWGWIGPWVALARARTPIYLYTCTTGERTVGMAFFTRRQVTRRGGIIRATQLQLNEFNAPKFDMIIEYNGILSLAGFERESWAALPGALADSGLQWDELAFRSLDAAQLGCARDALSSLREETDRSVPSWAVSLDTKHADEEVLLSAFQKKTRQQLRQTLREFEALGEIDVDVASTQEEAQRFFSEMEGLHSARWKKVGKSGSFANADWVRFHRDVITEGNGRGEVQFLRVTCAGQPIGVVYGYLWRGHLFAQQTGFKPQERTALRSGYLGHFKAMQQFAVSGARRYDFMPDDLSSYKRQLAEPFGILTSVRFQKPRLIFAFERMLLKVRGRGSHTPKVAP